MADLEMAVQADLTRWGSTIATSSVAAAALDVARRLDEQDLSAAAASMLHGQLRKYLAELRALAPAEAEDDDVVNLDAERRQRRRSAGMP